MRADNARALFDRNAQNYDRINSVISLGLVRRWRSWAARQAVAAPPNSSAAALRAADSSRGQFPDGTTPAACPRVLDAFAGTGLTGLRAAGLGACVTLADISAGMLAVARDRAARRGLPVDVLETDLTRDPLPAAPGSFDAVTIVFGLRYLDDPAPVLARLGRLLAPGGRLVVLEFVEPPRGPVSRAAAFYFFRMLPRVAAALARRRALYDYLVSSVHALGDAAAMEREITDAGLTVTQRRAMGFGLVHGVTAIAGGGSPANRPRATRGPEATRRQGSPT